MKWPKWNLLQSQFPDTVSERDLEHFELPSVIEETRPERFGRRGGWREHRSYDDREWNNRGNN